MFSKFIYLKKPPFSRASAPSAGVWPTRLGKQRPSRVSPRAFACDRREICQVLPDSLLVWTRGEPRLRGGFTVGSPKPHTSKLNIGASAVRSVTARRDGGFGNVLGSWPQALVTEPCHPGPAGRPGEVSGDVRGPRGVCPRRTGRRAIGLVLPIPTCGFCGGPFTGAPARAPCL